MNLHLSNSNFTMNAHFTETNSIQNLSQRCAVVVHVHHALFSALPSFDAPLIPNQRHVLFFRGSSLLVLQTKRKGYWTTKKKKKTSRKMRCNVLSPSSSSYSSPHSRCPLLFITCRRALGDILGLLVDRRRASRELLKSTFSLSLLPSIPKSPNSENEERCTSNRNK
jgi:hypothetical protein